jgi:hypothetical protein
LLAVFLYLLAIMALALSMPITAARNGLGTQCKKPGAVSARASSTLRFLLSVV